MRPFAPPTPAQTQAALSRLPDGFAGLGDAILAAPGLTADALLIFATALDVGATERGGTLGQWDTEVVAMASLANILRGACPRFPHPPRLPATPETAAESDAAIRRAAAAAGLGTAGGGA